MEKNRFLKLMVIFLLIVNAVTLVFLFMGHMNRRNGREEGPAQFIIEELKLDEKQQAAFKDLREEHQAKMKSIQDSIKIKRELLPAIIIAGDNQQADSVTTLIGNYQKQIELNTYSHFVKVYGLCNGEQKTKFKTIIGDILKMMGPKRKGPPPH